MGQKSEGQAEQLFKKFGQKLDSFIAEMKDSSENMSEEFESRFEELKKNFAHLEDEAKDFKANNKDKWDAVQDELNQAGQSLKQAFKNAFAKNN